MVQMRGSRNFHQGGEGPGQSDKKALTTIFLVFSLFYRSQMVNFKEIYRFSRLQMRSNFFQGVQLLPGGVQLLIPYRNPFNLWFSRGGPDPCPPPLWIRLGEDLTASWLRLQYIISFGLGNVNRQKNVSSFYCYIPYNKCLLKKLEVFQSLTIVHFI